VFFTPISLRVDNVISLTSSNMLFHFLLDILLSLSLGFDPFLLDLVCKLYNFCLVVAKMATANDVRLGVAL